jgi:hypothetical protein
VFPTFCAAEAMVVTPTSNHTTANEKNTAFLNILSFLLPKNSKITYHNNNGCLQAPFSQAKTPPAQGAVDLTSSLPNLNHH